MRLIEYWCEIKRDTASQPRAPQTWISGQRISSTEFEDYRIRKNTISTSLGAFNGVWKKIKIHKKIHIEYMNTCYIV